MTHPSGAVLPFPLKNGTVGTDNTGMSKHTAPRVTRDQAAATLANPAAVVLLDLTNDDVTLDPAPRDAVWADPCRLVLVTHADAIAAAAEAAGHEDFLGRLTNILNLELHALARAGEIPTVEEVLDVVAELNQYEAELAQVIPLFGGAA